MRALALCATTGLVLVCLGSTTSIAAVSPPTCTTTQTQRTAVLTAGDGPGGSARYYRFCGRGKAVIHFHGGTFVIEGGRCGMHVPGHRWVYFGLITNGPQPTDGNGFSLVMMPGNRPGSVHVGDSIVQVAGLDLAPRGTTTLARDLDQGTFMLGAGKNRVTGSWSCD
jgi:hypothetical protein